MQGDFPEYYSLTAQSYAGQDLEITAIEPTATTQNPLISYLPLRIPLSGKQVRTLIQPHRTTIIDVSLLRLPSPDVYQLIKSERAPPALVILGRRSAAKDLALAIEPRPDSRERRSQ